MKTSLPIRNALAVLSVLTLIAIPLSFVFRGMDLTDTGFVLANQHFFFSHPEHVSYWFHLYLTNLIGAVVDLPFGAYGLIAMKIASAIIFWIASCIVYKIAVKFSEAWIVLLSLAVSAFFWFSGKINIVHYNNLSALLYLLVCYFLFKGFDAKRSFFFFFAGFSAALAFFTRIPNVLAFFLFFAVPLWALLFRKKNRLPSFRCVLAYIAGTVLAALLVLLLMASLGHLKIYLDSVQSLFGTSSTDSKYGLFRIFKRTIRHTLRAGYRGFILLVLASLPAIPLLLAKRSKIRAPLAFLIAAAAIAALCYLSFPVTAIAGVAYIATITVLFLPATEKNERLTVAAILCASSVFCLCVGSDTGLDVSTYLYPLAVPLVIAILHAFADTPFVARSRLAKRAMRTVPVVIISYLAATTVLSFNDVYRDTEKLDALASSARLQGVYTGRARATALDSAVTEIRRRYAPGTELFVWDSAPLVHYATDTLPWLDNPWSALYVSDTGNEKILIEMLDQKKERANFAPILLAKTNPRHGNWPSEVPMGLYSQTIVQFIGKNGYALVWENEGFALYEKK